MPFSKNKGGFKLDADDFRVKVIGGKGKIQAASMAQMLGDGKLERKNSLIRTEEMVTFTSIRMK